MGELKGVLHKKYEEKQITNKFKKRQFVVYVPGSGYRDNYVKFSLIQGECSLIDDYEEGDSITVFYSLEGRQWENPNTGETEYFNDIKATHINLEEENIKVNDTSGDGDDLPF